MALNYPNRSYVADSIAGTLSTPITSVSTTFTSSTSLSPWTDVVNGSSTISGNIVVAVEYGTINEEKILCTYNAGTFTIQQRNYNGETAFNTTTAHPASSTFVVVWSATEAAEAQAAVQALVPNVLLHTGTTVLAQDIIIGGTSNAGASKFAAAADHVHNLSGDALIGALQEGGITISVNASNVNYNINQQTGTSYSASQSDANNIIVMTNGTGCTVTLPASLNNPGQSITIVRKNAAVTITGTNVVSTGATSTAPSLRAVGAVATAIFLSSGLGWVVVGDIV
jgi:hypothetical protein